MFKQVILICAALSLVLCEPPVPQYGVPFNNAGGGGGGYNNYNQGGGAHGVNNGVGTPITSYGAPSYDNNQGGHGGGHGSGGHGGHGGHGDEGYGEPKAYEFGYQVKDDYTGTNYNRQEQSDGNQVTGSYRVALPDGRTQIVTYYADWKTGFHADVRYEGEAQYPDQYNTNQGYNYNQNQGQQYQQQGHNQGFNQQNQGYNYNQNQNQNYNQNQQYYNAPSAPSNQYGAPVNPVAINNQYAALSNSYGTPNTGSYDNYNQNNQNYNQNQNYNNNYDTYANSGFGNKVKPTAVYGAP